MLELDGAREVARRMTENVERVIIGKPHAVELGVIALVCQGHALIEDVPGVGKTMLARSIARSAGCEHAIKRAWRDSNPRPQPPQGCALSN